jgi:glyoxylase-like metal-dependent hydrolase (beta-lactamase superfamily II)
MKEIAPGIHVESAFPPYNLVLIQTVDSVVVVDIPPRPIDAMNWLEKILSRVDHIDFVVLTDASPERQMAALLWDIPIIATETTFKAMALYDEERARRDLLLRFMELYPEASQFVDQLKPRRPAIAFNHRFLLHNRTPPIQFEVVDGAAQGSLWVILPDLGLLIAGDTVCVDDVPPFDYIADSKAWLATLAALSRRQPIKRIVTGRGSAPVQRGEIERQREFLRIMRRTARRLSRGSTHSGNVNEIAQDLGQIFFNGRGQRAVKQIKRGLEKLIVEVRDEQVTVDDEEE